MKTKRGLDRDSIITSLFVSLISACGIVFIAVFFMDIDVNDCNQGLLVGGYAIISAIFWAIFLIRNC